MKLAIAVPCAFPMVSALFHEAFVTMRKPPEGYVYIRVKSLHSIDDMRNQVVSEALRLDCTHLFQLDSDILPHPNTIQVLLERGKSIVGALYFNRFPPYEPTAVVSDERFPEWHENDFYEVEKIGAGCLMINTDVFREMEPPWFKLRRDDQGNISLGEDFDFCEKVRNLGYRIWCDSTVTAKHINQMLVDETTRQAYESSL